MEKDTGAKIIIRGKGSVKEGKVILIMNKNDRKFYYMTWRKHGNAITR